MRTEHRFEPGLKGRGDKKLEINTHGEWYCMPFYDLLHIIKFCLENEDRIYPPPNQGRDYLIDAILALFRGENIDDIASRKKLTGGILWKLGSARRAAMRTSTATRRRAKSSALPTSRLISRRR